MHRDKVAVARHLGVQRGDRAARAVVVNDKVVYADDMLGIHHDVLDIFRHDRVGGLAEQRRDRVAGNADARPDDERRHENAHVAVNRERGEAACHHAEHDDRGRDNVIAAVLPRGDQHGRVDETAELDVERAHPQLYEHGDRENTGQQRGKRDSRRVENAVERGLEELKADQHDDERHDKTRDVLGAAVAERMLGVRLAVRDLEANDGNHAGKAVGQVVERIGGNGNRARHQTDGQLEREQKQVARESDRARKNAVAFAHGRRAGVLRVLDKKADESLCHNNPLTDKIWCIPTTIAA